LDCAGEHRGDRAFKCGTNLEHPEPAPPEGQRDQLAIAKEAASGLDVAGGAINRIEWPIPMGLAIIWIPRPQFFAEILSRRFPSLNVLSGEGEASLPNTFSGLQTNGAGLN
jgi:hypothetical protein